MKLLCKKKYLLLFSIPLLSAPAYGMRGHKNFNAHEWWANETAQFAKDMDRNIRDAAEQRKRNHEEQMRKFDADLRDAQTPEERIEIQKMKAEYQKTHLNSNERWDKAGAALFDVAKEGIAGVFRMEEDERKAETEKQKTAIKASIHAKENAKAMRDNVNNVIKACTEPKNARLLVLAGTGLALGVFGAKHGTALAAQMISHWYRIPRLAQETSLLTWRERMGNFIYGIKPPQGKIEDVILEPKLQERVSKLAESLKNTIKNGAYLKNILFYGPPGTGKTMLAKRLAYNCGLDYIYFAASALDTMSLDLALSQLTELFEFAKKSAKKLMIIIDEAEILFANRDKNLSENTRKLLTHILTYTGTETRDFMVIALTNRPEDLDGAFLSRCAEQIKIDAPASEQRKHILKQYIHKYLEDPSQLQPQATSFLGRLFGSKEAPKAIVIEPNALNEDAVDALNKKLEGFVGREISQLVLEWQSRAYATESGALTADIVQDVANTKIEQKKTGIAGFGKPHAAAAA